MIREDIIKQLPGGFVAMPYWCVTLNGMPLERLVQDYLQKQDEVHRWALIAPNGRAVDGELSPLPHRYDSLEEAVSDAAKLLEHGECSTCGPTWRASK